MATTGAATADEEQIRAVIADRAAAMHDRDAERFVSPLRAADHQVRPRATAGVPGAGSPRRRGAVGLVWQPPWRARRPLIRGPAHPTTTRRINGYNHSASDHNRGPEPSPGLLFRVVRSHTDISRARRRPGLLRGPARR